eukprot:780444-Rhodomonas_salina.1
MSEEELCEVSLLSPSTCACHHMMPSTLKGNAACHSIGPRCRCAISGSCIGLYSCSSTGVGLAAAFSPSAYALAMQCPVLAYIRCPIGLRSRYAVSGGDGGCATQRNQIQENAISMQFVPGMRFLVFDFGVCSPRQR